MKKLGIAVTFFFLIFSISYGYLTNNKSCKAFIPPCDDSSGSSSITSFIPSLSKLLVEGGNIFHISYSNFNNFLGLVELSELYTPDIQSMKAHIDNAFENIQEVKIIYSKIITFSTTVYSYNPVFLEKLRDFDYRFYQEQNKMNNEIFGMVEGYLKKGNVIGVYEYFSYKADEIFAMLFEMKQSIDAGKIPDISKCWRLNQLYADTSQFGQYVSEVFMNL